MHPAQKKKAIEQQSIWQELREGLSYMHQHTALQLVLLLQFLIAFLVYPFTVLLPIFADNIFHIGPTGLGALNAAAGIGALIGSILVVLLSQRIERGAYILITLCSVGGLASLVIALTHSINMVLLLLMVLGASTVMSSIVTNTTVQTMVPEAIRGRILSIWVMITFGLAPFGNLITGWIAQAIGAPLTLGIGGALCLSVTLLIACIQQVQHRVKLA
jgi:MFS family permease